MPATARQCMRVDHIIDERMDPCAATEGATRLLKRNLQVLGDWPLALTATLKEMRRVGVNFSVDDLGTSIPSLSCMTRFAVDRLKIDKTFVRGMLDDKSSNTGTSTYVAMASELAIETVAEGNETEVQMNVLREIGCNSGQGYYFARPCSQEALVSQLGGHQWRFAVGHDQAPHLEPGD